MKINIPQEGIGIGYWNLRVVQHGEGERSYVSVHEVHYAEDGTVQGYGSPVVMIGETPADLRKTLRQLRDALAHITPADGSRPLLYEHEEKLYRRDGALYRGRAMSEGDKAETRSMADLVETIVKEKNDDRRDGGTGRNGPH